MEKYLPVGNDFVSLPKLNERTGGIEDLTFLYMAAKGLIELCGSADMPLMQPFVRLPGQAQALPGTLQWQRIDDWLPVFTARGNGLSVTGTYLTPVEERGFSIRLVVQNTSDTPQTVEIGMEGCWESSWHRVNESKKLQGKAACFPCGWYHTPIFEFSTGYPMFAFAPLYNVEMQETYAAAPNGAITYALMHKAELAAGQSITVDFFWGLGFEETAAATSAMEMKRQSFDVDLTRTRAWLQARRTVFESEKLTRLYNTNLFFCLFFSSGVTLDTEELVFVTSRSPRYYVSAAYWDRDSLLWSFPAVLDVDPQRAKKMLGYVFGRQRRNLGIHSRYIDGTMLEPGFELDELAAPLLALERYVHKTGDRTVLNNANVREGIELVLERLAQHKAQNCDLYDTFLQPTDDEHVYPYITYDNVLVWKALHDLAELMPEYAALAEQARNIRQAIYDYCVQQAPDGKKYFAWSVDLNGHHDVYDEPPGSLQLLPLYGFCEPEDEVYRTSVDMIRSPEYKYSFADSSINEIGCPHAPHPWILSVANSLLCGRKDHCLAILEKLQMDNGIACESVDEETGLCTSGEAFATCAGFLCHAIRTVWQ